ncbi:MAG: hypothetical protein IPJ82_06070 [Lewinellaceae bacterium]|nr:hypothetical protein [Lewinellaceae bacterium]
MTHLIQRQYIHVDLQGSESEGFALQNRLSDFCNEWLNPAIGRVLDRCAPPGGRLCIERLEVDAGALPLENFESGLTEAVVQALEKVLLEQMPPGAAYTSPASAGGAKASLKNERQTAAEAFLYFLETGRLPWSFRLPPGVSFEQYLLDTGKTEPGGDADAVSPVFPAQLSRTSLSRTLSTPQARSRLVMQFSGPFLHALLLQISPETHVSVARIFEAMRMASVVPRPEKQVLSVFENHLWETAFRQATQPVPAGDIPLIAIALAAKPEFFPEIIPFVLPALKDILHPAVLPEFVRQMATHSGPAFPAFAPLLQQHLKTLSNPLSPEIQSLLKTNTAPAHPGKRHSTRKTDTSTPAGKGATETDFLPASPGSGETGRSHGPNTGNAPDPGDLPGEGVYVDNAGLVILHPFLQMFFENLGVARAGALVEPDRALQLLHFLCTGQTPAPEYELVLPKLLCNIPLEDPVTSDIILTDKEKEESIALLESAIRWWEALRSTSPDALRGTFLCRPGKLSVRGDGDWLLQVERQSFDILLDHLPWGISAVKLPWMERILWVEWG